MIKKLIPKKLKNSLHFFYAWYGAFKYKHPSEEMTVIGITGTTGKSSISFILRQVLEAAGHTVGSLSTIDFYIAGEQKMNDRKMTMLGKMDNQKYLREMVDKKCDIAIVETTSEGRLQHRHRFINYDMMVLTNLYPEHIESHGSFENYKQAKLDIFDYVSKCKIKRLKDLKINKSAIVNLDCEYYKEFLDFNFEKKHLFSTEPSEKSILQSYNLLISSKNIKTTSSGLSFELDNHKLQAPLFGKHNVENLTCVYTIAKSLGIADEIIKKAFENLKPIPGRIEFIKETLSASSGQAEKGFQVIVDYAFEPKAIKALYGVVELLKPKRVIHVFGSTGGGRDIERRFSVGEFVGKNSDVCIVTDEDPYDDNPEEIINDVASAVEKTGKVLDKDLFKILDRGDAIKKAVEIAKKGDLILVTGKGSEQAMCVSGGKIIPWDDREEVRRYLDIK